MPCLWPRPERGRIIAAKPGIADVDRDAGRDELRSRPARASSGASMQARRSRPGGARRGVGGQMRGRMRSSRILTSTRLRRRSLMSAGEPRRDLGDEPPRQRELAGRGSGCAPRVVEQRDLVVVAAERVLRRGWRRSAAPSCARAWPRRCPRGRRSRRRSRRRTAASGARRRRPGCRRSSSARASARSPFFLILLARRRSAGA